MESWRYLDMYSSGEILYPYEFSFYSCRTSWSHLCSREDESRGFLLKCFYRSRAGSWNFAAQEEHIHSIAALEGSSGDSIRCSSSTRNCKSAAWSPPISQNGAAESFSPMPTMSRPHKQLYSNTSPPLPRLLTIPLHILPLHQLILSRIQIHPSRILRHQNLIIQIHIRPFQGIRVSSTLFNKPVQRNQTDSLTLAFSRTSNVIERPGQAEQRYSFDARFNLKLYLNWSSLQGPSFSQFRTQFSTLIVRPAV